MARLKRRKFVRSQGTRRYRKLFIIFSEGKKTEPQYFNIFNSDFLCINRDAQIVCFSGKNSSPLHVLNKAKKYLEEELLRRGDEVWLVIDKDHWTDIQLNKLYQWLQDDASYNLAISNPNFECWLLMHFESAESIDSKQECSERLEKHLPHYDKHVSCRKIKPNMVKHAIKRAKQRDVSSEVNYPKVGSTTVYKLVERIIESNPLKNVISIEVKTN